MTVESADAPMPKPMPGDEHQLDDQVEQGRAERDVERRAGVLEAAQVAGAGQHDEHGGHAEEADVQVDRRLLAHLAGGPEQGEQRARQGEGDEPHDHAARRGQPHALHRLVGGLALVAGAEQAGHRRGGAVGQEDEDGVADQQDAAGDGEPGQGLGPDVAHDGGVGQDVERLGRQRGEGGDGEPEDLPVDGAHGAGRQAMSRRESRQVAKARATAPTASGTIHRAGESTTVPRSGNSAMPDSTDRA